MKLSQHTTEVIDKFAEMMIARMEAMRLSKWEKVGSVAITAPVQ